MSATSPSARAILASEIQPGQWLICTNPRQNQRVVDVSDTRDGQVRVQADYGNGGEPATLFFEKSDKVQTSDNNDV